jgi:trk system potassium uptake protein TrkA
MIISFISRDGKIIIPTGSDQISIGDNVMVVTTKKGFTELSDILK